MNITEIIGFSSLILIVGFIITGARAFLSIDSNDDARQKDDSGLNAK